MASFLELVETKIGDFFPYDRAIIADRKLTPSERERVAKLLQSTWHLAQEFTTDGTAAQEKVQSMEMTAFLPIYQMASFLFSALGPNDRRDIASPMQETYDDERVKTGLAKVMRAFISRLSETHGGRFFIPDHVSLPFFSFFDEWQEFIEPCIRT